MKSIWSMSVGVCLALGSLNGAGCSKASPTDHVQQGDVHMAGRRYAEAIIQFRVALQEDPKLGDARLKLADAYLAANDPRNAGREYVRAADLLPNNVEAQLKAATM